MTEPTTQQMREWLSAASPQTKIKYQWVGILLNRLEEKDDFRVMVMGAISWADEYGNGNIATEILKKFAAMGQSHD